MTRERVQGTSRLLSETDLRKRDFAWDIVRDSNEVVVGFARLMVPTSLSALGVIVAIAGTRFAGGGHGGKRLLIGLSCLAVVVATVLFAHSIFARRLMVSAEDYQDVLAEIGAITSARRRETSIAFGVFVAGLLAAASVFLT
jgi:hypothetical protein